MDMISSIELGFAKESQASSLYANDATPALDPLATPTLDPLATPTARGLDPLDFNPVVRHGKKPKKPKKPKKHHPEECECEPEEEEPCDHQCTIIKAKPSSCRVVRNGPIQQKGNGLGVSDMELKCALLNEPHTVVWDSRNECAQQAAANDEGAGISAPQPNQPQPNLPQPNQPQSNPPQANGSGCAVSGCAVSGCGREAILPNDVITANVQQDPVAREASGVIEQHAPAPKDIMNVNAQTVPAANDAAIGAAQQAPIPNDASVFPPAKAA
ncbi:hypothetical protein GGI12_001930 [Dipsacomyces acuminosporus]|nr:hypothetical protein GGI12_001930 [Dipsacomyces acuminosporus]